MVLIPSLSSADPLDVIEASWQNCFERATVEGGYHYQCRMTQQVVAENAELVADTPLTSIQYDIEVARLGQAHSMRLESDTRRHPWIEVFDGDAKYVSQSDSDWSVQPRSYLLTKGREASQILADPLADVLGLSNTTLPAWSLRSGFTHAVFNLSDGLSNRRFRVLEEDENEVDLVSLDGETVTLSKQHGHAIARRSWSENALEPIALRLENRDWSQLANGTWYPKTSAILCELEADRSLLYRLDFAFSAGDRLRKADFAIHVEEPGAEITFFGGTFADGRSDIRHRLLNEGERIDLNQVATRPGSIRWSSRQWPTFTFLESWNLTPIFCLAILLAGRSGWLARIPISPSTPTLLGLSALLGITLLVLIHLAMEFYAGGTAWDRSTLGYSWSQNFLSDLGREYLPDHRPNRVASQVFQLAMTLGGVGLAFHMACLPRLFTVRIARYFALAACVSGFIAAWFFVRVGWTPIDWHYEAHQRFAMSAFILLGFTAGCYATALLRQKDYPRRFGRLLLLLCFLTAMQITLRVLDDGRIVLGTDWLLRQVLMQKLLFYSAALTMLYQIRGAILWLNRHRPAN
ncbi:hypothetical protein [Rubripirellula obstinata]|nr:hypothetical protein [Rubripirellula obstinata]